MRRLLFTLAALMLSSTSLGCKGKSEASAEATSGAVPDKRTLTIWWAQWAPADGLQELATEFDPNVTVKVHQIPWASFQDQVFQEFGKSKTAFDIVVGDSQWLGRGATKGLYLDLSNWLATGVNVGALHPMAVKYLSEYPAGSRKYYAAPCETDAMGFAYRKDWLENPDEKAAFSAKYRRELGIPETWDELKDLAEFFTRPEKKQYGVALVTGRGYDDIVMGFEQVLYAFGGAWADDNTKKVSGVLDSPASIKALDFFQQLLKYSPPGGAKFGYGEALEPFVNGSTGLLMNYFAFFPDLAKKMEGKVGFFAMPKNGERRFASLGGQGCSISAKTTPEQQELAKRFIGWFSTLETQKKWVQKPGGFTANVEILKSDEFKKASPYNQAFATSMDIVQDFWNVPSYNELIAAATQRLGEALDGKKSSKEALATLAAEHEKILADSAP
jgi:multiple sugar transport system substrate-binding protein